MNTEALLEELLVIKHSSLKLALQDQNILLRELETLKLKIKYNDERIKNAEKEIEELDELFDKRALDIAFDMETSNESISPTQPIEPEIKDSEIEEALQHKSVSPEPSVILLPPKVVRRGLKLVTREEAEAMQALEMPTQMDGEFSEIISFHDDD
jgi:hypothetical protein